MSVANVSTPLSKMAAQKDAAGIYFFNHSDSGGDDSAQAELQFLRALVEEQKARLAELEEKLKKEFQNGTKNPAP